MSVYVFVCVVYVYKYISLLTSFPSFFAQENMLDIFKVDPNFEENEKKWEQIKVYIYVCVCVCVCIHIHISPSFYIFLHLKKV
jgi:hypothetical protein